MPRVAQCGRGVVALAIQACVRIGRRRMRVVRSLLTVPLHLGVPPGGRILWRTVFGLEARCRRPGPGRPARSERASGRAPPRGVDAGRPAAVHASADGRPPGRLDQHARPSPRPDRGSGVFAWSGACVLGGQWPVARTVSPPAASDSTALERVVQGRCPPPMDLICVLIVDDVGHGLPRSTRWG